MNFDKENLGVNLRVLFLKNACSLTALSTYPLSLQEAELLIFAKKPKGSYLISSSIMYHNVFEFEVRNGVQEG